MNVLVTGVNDFVDWTAGAMVRGQNASHCLDSRFSTQNVVPHLFSRSDWWKRWMRQTFRLLRLIPYPHLAPLMRACTATLNPSLFEAVEEAKTMDTPMVLSDLDVHREQMGEQAIYFDRNSAQSLADTLSRFVALPETQREQLTDAAREAALHRVERFAEDFANLAEYCLDKSTPS